MHYSVSNNAEYGDLTRGKFLIDSTVKARMKDVLKDIQSGKYALEFVNEMKTGSKNFAKLRAESENHQIEQVGEKLRGLFNWSQSSKLVDRTKN